MSTAFNGTVFSVAAHSSISLEVAFNGNTTSGGDLVGPMAVAPQPTRLNQSVNVSTTSVKFLRRNSNGLTSQCIYLYTVTNRNAFHVSFVTEFFFD